MDLTLYVMAGTCPAGAVKRRAYPTHSPLTWCMYVGTRQDLCVIVELAPTPEESSQTPWDECAVLRDLASIEAHAWQLWGSHSAKVDSLYEMLAAPFLELLSDDAREVLQESYPDILKDVRLQVTAGGISFSCWQLMKGVWVDFPQDTAAIRQVERIVRYIGKNY